MRFVIDSASGAVEKRLESMLSANNAQLTGILMGLMEKKLAEFHIEGPSSSTGKRHGKGHLDDNSIFIPKHRSNPFPGELEDDDVVFAAGTTRQEGHTIIPPPRQPLGKSSGTIGMSMACPFLRTHSRRLMILLMTFLAPTLVAPT